MAHNLFLAMYTFNIKKSNSKGNSLISNNDFLSNAYPDLEHKFSKGFAQDVISLMDNKIFKNEKETHGALLDAKSFNQSERSLDLLIDGGLTGIQQFLINEDGKKINLSKKDIVGPKFYARIWLPAASNTGYLFIQKYGSISIKPIFDSIIMNVFKNNGYHVIGSKINPATTKVRQEIFMKYSTIRDVTIVSKRRANDTGSPNASTATIKLSKVKLNKEGMISQPDIVAACSKHGIVIDNRHYDIKATYVHQIEDYKEEKSVYLDGSEETINIIPNIIIPNDCIDSNNYPIFENMKKFVDREIEQVKKEAKI